MALQNHKCSENFELKQHQGNAVQQVDYQKVECGIRLRIGDGVQ